jgi:hypothetical protein
LIVVLPAEVCGETFKGFSIYMNQLHGYVDGVAWAWRVWLGAVLLSLCSIGVASPAVGTMKLLTAADFSSSRLKGFNLGTRQQPPLVEADYRDMAATGANLARIIVLLKKCDGCAGYAIAASDIGYVDEVVAMGEKYGFYVVLTLSPRPAGDKAVYWKDAGLKKSIQDNWVRLAARYRGRAGIAAYDLINEPVPQVWFDPQDSWREFSSSLIEAIRGSDPEHVIVVEPIDWGHASGMAEWKPLPYANLVYSFHFYEPYKLTHQGLYDNRDVIAYPNPEWDKNRLSKMLEPVRKFVRTYKVPVLVGEFSIVRWAPGNSVQDYLRDAITLFEQEDWPWLYHAFREYPGWDPEMPRDAEREPSNRKAARREGVPTMDMLKRYMKQN